MILEYGSKRSSYSCNAVNGIDVAGNEPAGIWAVFSHFVSFLSSRFSAFVGVSLCLPQDHAVCGN